MIINDFYNKRLSNHYETDVIYNSSRLSDEEIVEVMWEFTETFKRHRHAHKAIREAACLEVQYPAMMLGIEGNDLLVGRFDNFPIHFSPQITPLPNPSLGYAYREDFVLDLRENGSLSPEAEQRLDELIRFWRVRHTKQKFYNTCPDEERRYMPYRHYTTGPGSFFTLFRIAGIFLDYDKLLTLGLPGLIGEIQRQARGQDDPELFEGMRRAVGVVIDTALFYANLAADLAAAEAEDARRDELLEMARICRKLSSTRPETFHEALQLAYLYTSICGAREYGRLDEYLGDYYAADLAAGRIDEERAIRLLESMWRLVASREQVTDDRVIIGGMGRRNPENADQVALLSLEASRRVRDIVPQLTLRCHRDMSPAVYKKALEVIGEGTTYPLLYNDEVNVPAVMNAYGVSRREAVDYMPLGCGEYAFNHSRIGSPNAAINLLEILLSTLRGGVETMTGKQVSPDRGTLEDFETFDELWQAYADNVEYFMRLTANQVGRLYRVMAEDCSLTLLTPLYDDCLRRGKALLEGGIKGLDGSVEVYGLVNTADSLLAIRELVYERRRISPGRMLQALEADFEGYDEERRMMLATPKFGNDLDAPDAMMARVHEHACYMAMAQSGKFGLDRYLIVNINNNVNTLWGRQTPASPDGRRAGMPMSNGNNPSPGMDTSGLTAFVNSLLKARTDIHAGVAQNFKLSREMFDGEPSKAQMMLDAYFEAGGAQAMMTVVGREELESARQHPERYGNLIVRVGGFSARYVELDDDVQQEILERTLY